MFRYARSYPPPQNMTSWPDQDDWLPAEMEKADLILITHPHQDHCKKETIERLRKQDTRIFAPSTCSKKITGPMEIVKVGEQRNIADISIQVIAAYNTEEGDSTRKIHKKGDGVGYHLTLDNGLTIYHAGDTDFIPEMKALGRVDLAFIPIGGVYTMDIGDAVKAVSEIKPRKVVPMHFLDNRPEDFANQLDRQNKIEVKILRSGESLIYE
jgi:L-ascorbate metabolism protein UlaG (beta-lactamase superfamily)